MPEKDKIVKSKRINLEQLTIGKMIGIYCTGNHNTPKGILCNECKNLHEYAFQRLSFCPFQKEKPVCSECTVHCYKPDMRQKVKEVMRYSGPKMIFKHPYLAIMHLYYEKVKNKINKKLL